MCGITGIVQFERMVKDDGVIDQMTIAIGHRGPDAMQTKKYGHAHLGHQRLAIIDVTYGQQPMTKRRGQQEFTIVYNGELYNTNELRQDLQQKGYQFTTSSDTEVLLVCYMHYGPEACLQRLNGIFSFAVWEEHSERLFLARDRLGVKPLFYVQQSNTILFASEMKALLQHPSVEPVVDQRGLQQLLTIGPSRMLGETVFHQIKEVKPGHAALFTKDQSKLWCYWRLQATEHTDSLQQTFERTRELLQQTVEQQLVSDVPLCTLLSGGVDSSILTAMAANVYKERGHTLATFSVDYEDNEKFFTSNEFQQSEDGPYIKEMIDRYKTEHETVIVTPEQLVEALEQALHLKDYPSMTDVDSSLYIFCQHIAKDYKVALSGECADELFGGYPWYFGEFEGFPWVRQVAERERLLKPTWQQALQLTQSEQQFYEEAMANIAFTDRQQQLTQLNFDYFMQTLLERKDRMSMGSGLEVRVPFANHELVEYIWNIPWAMKTTGGQAKGLLRKAVEDLLPEAILTRKKTPYPKIQHPRYTRLVKDRLQQALLQQDSILLEFFDEQQLRQLIEDESAFSVPWFGQLMSRPQLMAYLLQMDTWVRKNNVQFML